MKLWEKKIPIIEAAAFDIVIYSFVLILLFAMNPQIILHVIIFVKDAISLDFLALNDKIAEEVSILYTHIPFAES